MADDKTKRGAENRRTVAADAGYEIGYFARKHGLSPDEARELVDKVGNDRDKLDVAARRMKAR